MPTLHKFLNNARKHKALIDKNLTANLIRHEYIVTGNVKAKRAQAKIESFLAKTMDAERAQAGADAPVAQRMAANKQFDKFIQPADKPEIASKILTQLAGTSLARTRRHGFTRILKLEPRLGLDRAPQSVLELVDSEYSVFYWYIVKVVARLELQGLPVDELTGHNVKKLTQFKEDGEAKFRAAVETCKAEFFSYNAETQQVEDAAVREHLASNVPNAFAGEGTLLASKKFKTMKRAQKQPVELPQSPFLKQ